MNLAGLLACIWSGSPSHPRWRTVVWSGAGLVCDTYSYGDSAGITPDFPFNDAWASTKSAQMYIKTRNRQQELRKDHSNKKRSVIRPWAGPQYNRSFPREHSPPIACPPKSRSSVLPLPTGGHGRRQHHRHWLQSPAAGGPVRSRKRLHHRRAERWGSYCPGGSWRYPLFYQSQSLPLQTLPQRLHSIRDLN